MSSVNDNIAIPIETEPTSIINTSTSQDNSMCYNSICCCNNGNNCDYSSCAVFWCIIDFICGGCCSAM